MTQEKQVCFVIMPITTYDATPYGGDTQHFTHVYEDLFVPSIEAAGFTPLPPTASGSEVIHARVIGLLDSAALVICDLSALNPNVLFELGVRTALNKPVALVADTHTDFGRVFDLQPNHIHQLQS